MNTLSKIFLLLSLISLVISCKPRFDPEITMEEIEEHIKYLASEELAGRYPGTPEDALLSAILLGPISRQD